MRKIGYFIVFFGVVFLLGNCANEYSRFLSTFPEEGSLDNPPNTLIKIESSIRWADTHAGWEMATSLIDSYLGYTELYIKEVSEAELLGEINNNERLHNLRQYVNYSAADLVHGYWVKGKTKSVYVDGMNSLERSYFLTYDPAKDERRKEFTKGSYVCVLVPKNSTFNHTDYSGTKINVDYAKIENHPFTFEGYTFYFRIEEYKPAISLDIPDYKYITTYTDGFIEFTKDEKITYSFNAVMANRSEPGDNTVYLYMEDNPVPVPVKVGSALPGDDPNVLSVPLKTAPAKDGKPPTSYFTIDLSEVPNLVDDKEIRIEIPVYQSESRSRQNFAMTTIQGSTKRIAERPMRNTRGEDFVDYVYTTRFRVGYTPKVIMTDPHKDGQYKFNSLSDTISIWFNCEMDTKYTALYVHESDDQNWNTANFSETDLVTGIIRSNEYGDIQFNRFLEYTPPVGKKFGFNKYIYVRIPTMMSGVENYPRIKNGTRGVRTRDVYEFSFKTMPPLCILPEAIYPSHDATYIGKNVIIEIPFNRPVDSTDTSFQINVDGTITTVSGYWNEEKDVLIYPFLYRDIKDLSEKTVSLSLNSEDYYIYDEYNNKIALDGHEVINFTMSRIDAPPQYIDPDDEIEWTALEIGTLDDENINFSLAGASVGDAYISAHEVFITDKTDKLYGYSKDIISKSERIHSDDTLEYKIIPFYKNKDQAENNPIDYHWIDGSQAGPADDPYGKSVAFKIEFTNLNNSLGMSNIDIGLLPYSDPFIDDSIIGINSDNANIKLFALFDDSPLSQNYSDDVVYFDKTFFFISKQKELVLYSHGKLTNIFRVGFDAETKVGFGDDYVLNFMTRNENDDNIYTFANTEEGQTAVNEFLYFFSAYDKKLLWRANLFINEDDFNIQDYDVNSTTSLNDSFDGNRNLDSVEELFDWNDLNPWINNNEWNYIHKGIENYIGSWNNRYIVGSVNSTYTDDNLSELIIGNGGQVVNILPSTWPHRHNNDPNTNTDIDGSVIYYFGASNSPYSYNDKLENWRQDLRSYYQNKIINYTVTSTPYPGLWDTLSQWATTYAPGEGPNHQVENAHVWENYDYDYGNIDTLPGAARFRGNIAQGGFYDQFNVNADNNITGYYDTYAYSDDRTIGVDCGGLIYMSASYENNPYDFDGEGGRDIGNGYRDWLDVDEEGTTLDADDPPGATTEADNLWYITYKPQLGSPQNLRKIIPGDIMYYIEGSTYHVAMIHDIDYPDDINDLTINHINLIESVYGEFNQLAFGNVIKIRTINDYNTKDWRVGRLKYQLVE